MKNIKEYIKKLNEYESVEYEYKIKLNKEEPRKWAKTVVAFANKYGGKLYVGVCDDGRVIGIDVDDVDTEQRYFVDFVKQRITPQIDFEIEYIHVDEKKVVLCIDIKEFKGDIVRYINKDKGNEEVFVRKPGSTYLADFDESMRLYLRKSHEPYDARITEHKIDNYTFHSLNEKYKEMNNTFTDVTIKQLMNTKMANEEGFLTIAGMLFVDKREEQFPLIHMRKWVGFSKGDDVVLDRKEFRGNIIDQLEMAILFIKNNTKTGFVKLPNGRRDIDAYPDRSIIEALCNALAHRDYTIPGTQIDVDIYQDRLVIMSPGSFVPEGNAQDYESIDDVPSKRRNEVICDVFAMCKLMERSGSGFEKIKDVYKSYDNRFQPYIKSYPDYFSITLMDLTYESDYLELANYKKKETTYVNDNKIDAVDKEIILLMKKDATVTQNEIATQVKKSRRTVQTRIKKLQKADIIEREGSNKKSVWIVKETLENMY